MKRKTLLLMLLIVFAMPWAAMAQFSGGNGSASAPYQIANAADWNTLANGISSYKSSHFIMTADITTGVTTMVGTSSNHFQGTFNGGGHTLTVNLSGISEQGVAPFQYIEGATIKNLKVDGSVTATQHHGGGLVGFAWSGTNTIENCLVSTNVTNTSNDNYIGGIVGHGRGSTVKILGCVYNGTLKSAGKVGGLLGWSDNNINYTAINSIFDGTVQSNDKQFNPFGFKNGNVTSTATFINCYSTKPATFSDSTNYNNTFEKNGTILNSNLTLNGVAAKLCYSIGGGSNVTVALTGNSEANYGVSGITGYTNSYNQQNSGISYNGTIYAGNNDAVSLLLSYTGSNVLESYNPSSGNFSSGSAITGNNDAYTLTMPSSDVTINVTTTAQPVLRDSDGNYMTWAQFAANVLNDNSYSGKTVYLDADVTVTEPIGIQADASSDEKNHFFKGTFDGQGHTVTLDMTATRTMYGLFAVLEDAKVKDLIIDGSISNTNHRQIGGLAGYTLNTCTITNCLSNVSISSSKSDDICGGFIAEMGGDSKVTFEGCAFTGTLTAQNNCGGFVGQYSYASWNKCELHFNNCLFTSTNSSCATNHKAPFSYNTQTPNASRFTTINSYYTTAFGTVQGKQAYSVTGQSPVTVEHSGTGTNYDVSTITGYDTGIKYNDVLYAGNGESLSLTLNGANTYEADHGTLTGSSNPYTLTMVASNTVISGIFCAAPTNLRCTYYTRNSVTLEWTAGGDEEAWQVKCWPNNQQEPEDLAGYTTNVSTNPYTLTDLTQGQTYHVKVRAKCDENDFSDYTSSIDVTPGRMTYYFVGSTNDNGWNTINNWRYYVGGEPYTATTLPTIEDNVTLNADVTIPANFVATAYSITNTDPDDSSITHIITIADGGQLQHNNTGVTAKAEKVITGYGSENVNTNNGYHLISSPIDGGTGDFANLVPTDANEYDIYSFDYRNGQGLLEWVDVTGEDGTHSLDNTVGYLYARQTDATISTPEGTILPSNTDKPVYLQYDGTNTYRFDGWNLVGNPFVCNAYVSGFEGQGDGEGGYQPSKTAAQLSYYVLNSEGNEFVVPQPLGAIAPMGAIMVQATAANQFAVFSRTAPASKGGSLNLNITGNATRGTIDRAVLAFGNTMPLGKFQLNPDHTKVYIPMDGNDYAVAKVEGAGAVPVNFKAEHSGRYTISVNAEEVSFNYLHFVDNMTGADIDLLATPSYSFESRTTDYESRFRLVFATGDNSASESFAFFSNGTYVINNDGDATLQVIDLTGRVLSSEAIQGSVSKAIQAAPGVYMLRLINGNDVKVQKVVVK